MKRLMPLSKALQVLSFYRWAFGDLTEQDSDVGALAEFLVGDLLGCLPPSRKVNAPLWNPEHRAHMADLTQRGLTPM